MNRLLACGTALPLLVACGAGSGSQVGIEDPELAQLMSEVRAGPAVLANGRTLPVPSAKYPTIASALAAAQPGDRVRVAAGTYAECPVLVDGVTLEGHIVRGEAAAILDGAGCALTPTCTGVVCAGADIVDGAELRGFRIVNAPSNGIDVRGSTDVRVSDVVIDAPGFRGILGTGTIGLHVARSRVAGAGAPRGGITLLQGSTAWVREFVVEDAGHGLRADGSTFVVEDSAFGRNGSGVMLVRGARGALIRSEIRESSGDGVVVQTGAFLNDPRAAPSKVWLRDNVVRDNEGSGFSSVGRGSGGKGFNNRFEANWDGIHVTGGSEYAGHADTMSRNSGVGAFSLGCELVCVDLACSEQAVVQEESRVSLKGVDIRNNQGQGVVAGCGAIMDLRDSVAAGSGNGAVAIAYIDWGAEPSANVPSSISAQGTVFANNEQWGVISYDSFLDLGTLADPGWNSFLSNGVGSIANVSSNPVPAQWNWFGTTDRDAIAASIGGYGVEFEPYLTQAP